MSSKTIQLFVNITNLLRNFKPSLSLTIQIFVIVDNSNFVVTANTDFVNISNCRIFKSSLKKLIFTNGVSTDGKFYRRQNIIVVEMNIIDDDTATTILDERILKHKLRRVGRDGKQFKNGTPAGLS